MNLNIEPFKTLDADPGGTLQRLNRYVDRMKLLFDLVFRQADGSPYNPSDKEKKAMMVFRGGEDMANLFLHVGKVLDNDTFDEAVTKISDELKKRTNKVVQRNTLLTRYPQGKKSFEKWSMEIANAAKLIDFTGYDWKEAAVDAIVLQTSNSKLREKALQENAKYDDIMSMGIVKEQSEKGAAQLAGSDENFSRDEEVRKLQQENRKLRKKITAPIKCGRCNTPHVDNKKCPANGKQCDKCGKFNHLAIVCRTRLKPVRQVDDQVSDEDSEDEVLSRIIEIKKLQEPDITAQLQLSINTKNEFTVPFATDTGVRKTLINKSVWEKIKGKCPLVPTSKRFRPYGTYYQLPIIGRVQVTLKAARGATIKTWVYVVNSDKELSLLGEKDAIRLGIVKLDLKGAAEEVRPPEEESVRNIAFLQQPSAEELSLTATAQKQIDIKMEDLKKRFKKLFSDKTGKFKDDIHIQY